MKTIRESSIFSNRFKERKSVVGSYGRFNKDMWKQQFLTPHAEMDYCIQMFNRNSLANAGVKTAKDFIKGGEIRVKSLDEVSRKKAQEYLNDLNIDIWLDEVIENLIKTGNGYAELDFLDGDEVVKKVYPICDSSRIYINCDEFGKPLKTKKFVIENGEAYYKEIPDVDEYYIQRIDPQYKISNAKQYSLKYQFGSLFNQFQIYGIPIPKKNMIHIKLGIGDVGVYGRSDLASTITDFEILEQIERSIAIIAKHKAVPRDIIRYGSDENPATDDETNDFILYLESLQKDESAIINKDFKRETISYAGQDINLDYMIKHIKSKLVAGLAPEFALGINNQGGNKQSSQLTLLSYILSIYSKRKLILKPLEDKILKPFLQKFGLKDCWLEFGELDFETKSEKTNRIGSLWTQNVISLNEIRYQLGFPVLEAGNVFFSQWQQELLTSNPEEGNSDDDTSLKKIIQDSPDETTQEDNSKGSPGANTQQPSQRLPNNDSTDDTFNHRTAPNKTTIQKGSPIDRKNQSTRKLVKENLETKDSYSELMNDIKMLEKTITVTIETEDEQQSNAQEIDFKTLMDKFGHIFNEPLTTEMFYKKNDTSYEISFNSPRNVMIICNFTDDDIIEYYGRNTQLSYEQQREFIQNWVNQHTKSN